MTYKSQPRGKRKGNESIDAQAPKLPNAVAPKPMSVLIAKKRHMSGLMCPPMGALPEGADKSQERH